MRSSGSVQVNMHTHRSEPHLLFPVQSDTIAGENSFEQVEATTPRLLLFGLHLVCLSYVTLCGKRELLPS